MTDKLCKDCRWSNTTWWNRRWDSYPTFLQCTHPEAAILARKLRGENIDHLVTGKVPTEENSVYCSVMRLNHNTCGNRGIFFEKFP